MYRTMKRRNYIQINIPQPCQEDWSKMTPQEQGRFCDSCQKCVVDFTSYSDEELYKYLQQHKNEQVCGRVKSTQLNRPITLPVQPHSTLYKWIIAAGLALVISAVPDSPAFAQAPHTQEHVQDSNKTLPKPNNTQKVSGTVYNSGRAKAKDAYVTIFNQHNSYRTKTDHIGNFSFDNIDTGTYTIEAYIPTEGQPLQRGLVKNIVLDLNNNIYVEVALSAGKNNLPEVSDYAEQQVEIEMIYMGYISAPPKVKADRVIERMPLRDVQDIIQLAPGVTPLR